MRGDVRVVVDIPVPAQGGAATERVDEKYAVALQGDMRRYTHRVAVVLISTHNQPDRALWGFEVRLDPKDFEWLAEPSIIDCRWVFTIGRGQFEAGESVGQLMPEQEHDVKRHPNGSWLASNASVTPFMLDEAWDEFIAMLAEE